ncbi:MAG: TIM barrel protein [Pirellulales bacterium]
MHNPHNRRRFLHTTGLGIGAAALAGNMTKPLSAASPSAAALADDGSNMRFGLVTYLWGQHMDLPTLLDACSQSGLGGVEVRTEHKHGVEPSLTPAQRADVRKRFADSGVTLIGYGSNTEFHAADQEKVKANIELTKKYIQLMHDCGGSGVKVKPNGFAKDVPREKTIEQIGKALNVVGAYGAQYGQQIRVEVHGAGTSELPVIRDIFKVADHPNVRVCWNSNDEDLKGDGLEANFKMVQDRFGDTCHVRELDIGDYPYAKLMKLFRGISYNGWILLEARTDPKDKVAALKQQREVFERFVKG